MDTQICNCCNIVKSFIDYEWQHKRPNPRKTCIECRYKQRDIKAENARSREYKRKHYQSRKETIRQQWERSTYGASKEDLGYTECAICGSTQRLCIDHCHASLKIRGLLCSKCNTGLGMFRDNPIFLKRAADYIIDGPHFQLEK